LGGVKKFSISQLEKRQRKALERAAKRGEKKTLERARRMAIIPESELNEIVSEVLKMDYVTPAVVAERFNIKIGVAKQILKMLHSEGKLTLVSRNHRTMLFVPAAS